MTRKLILTVFYSLIIQFSALADYYPRDWNVDIQHYTFRLSLTDDSNLIKGLSFVDIYFQKDVQKVFLDLINRNSDGKGMKVSSVKIEGKVISYEHEKNRLAIIPETAFKEGENVRIEIEYEGIPIDGLIISNNKYGDRTFFGDNWPDRARHWLPSVDHPSDKASVDFIVQAPVAYQVIGNGVKLEDSNIDNGFKRTHWHEEIDISTKVMVIGVAQFAVKLSGMMENIPVEAWVYPQNREEGFYDYSQAVKVLDYFDNHIGDYSYKKLANVQSKTRYGGMENASNIFYSENSVTGKREIEGLIAHEIAHQWFGNSASEKDWHHVWLSEGFATYFTHLYMEHTYGVDLFRQRMTADRKTVIDFYDKNPVPIVNTEIRDYTKVLNRNSYQKGGWVLHMLRNTVGDQAFWEGIRNYYAKYRNSNALTEDLRMEMELATSINLETFFDQWIYKTGQPDLRVTHDYDDASKKLNVIVEQLQSDAKFIFPLDLQVTFNDGTTELFKAEVNQGKQSFSFDCAGKPTALVLDPYIKLLFTTESI